MYEVQKYLTLWNYCYDADLVIANSKVWDSLDEKTQDLLKECIAEACEWGNDKIVEDEKTLCLLYTSRCVEETGSWI